MQEVAAEIISIRGRFLHYNVEQIMGVALLRSASEVAM